MKTYSQRIITTFFLLLSLLYTSCQKYDGDSPKDLNTFGRVSSAKGLLPEGVNKETITEMNFNTNSGKKTDVVVSSAEGEKDCPVYLEMDGTVANFHTAAGCYTAGENMSKLFCGYSALKSLDLRGWNTSDAVNMDSLFVDCTSLESVDMSSFNTSKVTSMRGMFSCCSSLEKLDLSSFHTPTQLDIKNLFHECTNLRLLNLSNFDLTSVTNKLTACYQMSSDVVWCKIICSTKTKEILEDGDKYGTYLDTDKILWYLDGEMPEGGDDEKLYVSTDYSKDGQYKLLQEATVGKGIDIVFIGDAFSDRLIADGTYEDRMKKAMECFFELEPYKSLRNMFNVYEVFAVSKNETTSGNTALSTTFVQGRCEGGDADAIMFKYLWGVDVLVNVIVNDSQDGGKAFLYMDDITGDYGNGFAIAYIPLAYSEEEFGNILHHEAGGHGFAKLADEYYYDSYGEIPPEKKEAYIAQHIPYGYYKNIDFTDDPSKVKWSKFVTDPRYSSEYIGAYLGGLHYPYGVWRPSENSIMGDAGYGFNAPSREAIYYRAHKLAYGESWQYDYETFVEFDQNSYGKSVSSAEP